MVESTTKIRKEGEKREKNISLPERERDWFLQSISSRNVLSFFSPLGFFFVEKPFLFGRKNLLKIFLIRIYLHLTFKNIVYAKLHNLCLIQMLTR